MKAIVTTAYGSPDVLKLQEREIPTPKAGEVRVKVCAAAVTRADTMMRTGTPYFARFLVGWFKPRKPVPGTGFSGIVDAVGPEVSTYQVGDQIYGESGLNMGTYAEYACVDAQGVVTHKPATLPHAEAAVLADGAVTSWNFLHHLAQVQAGQKVLINGASGGLGTAAVQLAKALGAEVTGVCSARNLELVLSLGADHVLDYTQTDFTATSNRYDIVFDTVGKSSFQHCQQALKPQGLYLSPVLTLPLLWDVWRTRKSQGQRALFSATGLLPPEKTRPMLLELHEYLASGQLKVVIGQSFPLEEVVAAHQLVDGGHKRGNIALTMPVLRTPEPMVVRPR